MSSSTVLAMQGFGFRVFEENLPHVDDRWEVHPNVPSLPLWGDGAWDDFAAARTNLRETLQRAAGSMLLGPHVHLRERAAPLGLRTLPAQEGFDFEVFAGDVPLCGFQVKARQLSNGAPMVTGKMPAFVPPVPPPAADWPAKDAAVESLRLKVASQNFSTESATLTTARRCLYLGQGQGWPAWDLVVLFDGYAFHGIADDKEAFLSEARFFEGTSGTAKVYVENPSTGSLKDVDLSNLDADNTLTNDIFTTNPLNTSRATATDHNFAFSPSDERFDEVSAFAHANVQMDFFKSLGYKPSGPLVLLVVHAKPGGTANNALYQPTAGSDYNQPTIQIGDGADNILQNLPIDADVVSHELGHHIVFSYLKSTQNESLTIHEALADFFAFSRTGDACLGESICPSTAPDVTGGGACWVAKKCLRTADNSLKITDSQVPNSNLTFSKYGHLRGQVVSGMLWDLRKNDKIPAEDLTKLTYKAVSYLLQSSGYRDLLLGLLAADVDNFSGKYCAAIKEAALARAFDLADVNCSDQAGLPKVGSVSSASGSAEDSDDTSSSGKLLPFCGVVGVGASGWALIVFLLPPLLIALPRLRPVRVKKRSGD